MRLTICALSAVLLSGCSWLGMGGNSSHYSYENGANCGQSVTGYNQGAYGFQASAAAQGYGYGGCGFGAGQSGVYGQNAYGGVYGQTGGGLYGQSAYGQAGYGQTGFGQGGLGQAGLGQANGGFGQGGYTQGAYTQNGLGGQMGYGQMGAGSYGAQGMSAGLAANGVGGSYNASGFGTTTLSTGAPYGSAYASNVYGGGQYVNGAYVQNVQGSAIYVPQPYPAYYSTGAYGASSQFRGAYGSSYGYGGGYSGGTALPFGFEVGAGTSFDVGGDIFTPKGAGPALGAPSVNTGGSDGISYSDAFGQSKTIGGALTYDVSRNTTLLGGVEYSTANGQSVENYQTVDARGSFEGLDAEFSDLDLWTIEGGIRQYIGQSPALRPYIGATAGFTHNNDVTMNRTYTSDGAAYDATPLEYVEAGWKPTASAVIGAEMAVGSRAAIGVESGVRWNDNMDTIFPSEDRWSVPVKLRGRVSF